MKVTKVTAVTLLLLAVNFLISSQTTSNSSMPLEPLPSKPDIPDDVTQKPLEKEVRSVFPKGFKVPEEQVGSGGIPYPKIENTLIGTVHITGGFMEPWGHSYKPSTLAIFSNDPNRITALPASDRNLGIDYVVQDYLVRNWYAGVVTKLNWEGGYGLRLHVRFDSPFKYQGKEYILYGAYAHNQSCFVKSGEYIAQGQEICVMGGSGSYQNQNAYPPHVDFRTWVYIDGQQVDVSPNLIEDQLK